MQLICEAHPQVMGLSGGLRLVLNRPTVLAEPVVQGDCDVDGSGASLYGSVIRDGGLFRMWYQAWPRRWDGRDVVAVACAESEDGLSWRRPSYGLIECAGTKENHLTNLPFHCPSVLIDPDAPAEARYRAFGFTGSGRQGPGYGHRINKDGYYTAHSPDGLHWTLDSPDPTWSGADVITSVWDPYAGCARIALKNRRIKGIARRSFYTAEWTEGKASEPVSAFFPDEHDDMAARARGFHSADYYGVGLMPTEGATIGFLWNFRHQLPLGYYERDMFFYGSRGCVDISIVYQTERSGCWQHVTGRPDWLSAEQAPEWARGALYTAASPLEVGQESWLYFTGTMDRHGWCGDGVDYHKDWVKAAPGKRGWAKIGLAKWPKNRIMGYRADLASSIMISPGRETTREGKLVLNVVTEPGGQVRAQLLDADRKSIPGYSMNDCEPISGDHLEAKVRWRGKSSLPHTKNGESVVARIEMTKGTLYAFDFTLGQ